MKRTLGAIALTALALTATPPAHAGWENNPNTGQLQVCDRAGNCRDAPVKFNCNAAKNRENFRYWARLCGTR